MEKTIVVFGSSTLEFAEMQKIVQNKQTKNKSKKKNEMKFGANSALFGYVGL